MEAGTSPDCLTSKALLFPRLEFARGSPMASRMCQPQTALCSLRAIFIRDIAWSPDPGRQELLRPRTKRNRPWSY